MGGQKLPGLAIGGDMPTLAVCVHETGFGLVRRAVLSRDDVLLDDRLASGRQPVFPFTWSLGRVVGGQEPRPAERTATVLLLQEPQAGLVDRQGRRLAPSFGPVLGQRGVI